MLIGCKKLGVITVDLVFFLFKRFLLNKLDLSLSLRTHGITYLIVTSYLFLT